MQPCVMTVAQAEKFVCLSRSTLYRRVHEGTLTAIKLGGRTVFRVADLEAMVNNAPKK